MENFKLENGEFNFEKFKNFINTYSVDKHSDGSTDMILKDILYGIGISINENEFKYFSGNYKFLRLLYEYLHDLLKSKL